MRETVIKWSSFVLSFFVVLSMLGVASAQTVPLVYVNPQATIANPGDVFTIDVNIQDVVNMYSWGMKLDYDPNVLLILSVTEGPFLQGQPGGSAFVYSIFFGYIDAGATTLGLYPGVSGSGTLWQVTFEVKDLGAFDLDLYDTQLLEYVPPLTPIPHDVQDGSFETTWTANLVKRSAWPSYHHFDISKAGPYQTLNGKVKNLGPMALLVYVSFEIVRGDGFVSTVNTDPASIAPGSILDLSASFGPLTNADVGKYYVSAKAMYSFAGDAVSPGEKIKTFSFAVVP
jgi:hypothetical protein